MLIRRDINDIRRPLHEPTFNLHLHWISVKQSQEQSPRDSVLFAVEIVEEDTRLPEISIEPFRPCMDIQGSEIGLPIDPGCLAGAGATMQDDDLGLPSAGLRQEIAVRCE